MNFWEHITVFHKQSHENKPHGKQGLLSIQYLRKVFEPWCDGLSMRHPLIYRFQESSERSYRWLAQFARKIATMQLIPGSEGLLPRLVQESQYSSAFAEIEVALKMKLASFGVSFVQPNSDSPSPDLHIVDESISFNIEVSSLNPPDEHQRMNEFFNQISTKSFEKRVTVGGIISKTPTKTEIHSFMDKFLGELDRAVSLNEMRRVTEPGLFTLYVAPRGLEHKMPEDCRGAFRFIPYKPRPDKQRVLRKIHEKTKQSCVNNTPGVIVLYSETSPNLAVSLFEEASDDISATIATFPQLSTFVLTFPQRWYNIDDTHLKRTTENRTLLQQIPTIQESETTVIWSNPHGAIQLPETFLRAFENYPRNLSHLDNILE